MSQFSLDHLPEIPEDAKKQSSFTVSDNYLVSVFAQMGLGLAITAGTAFLFLILGGTVFLLEHPMLAMLLMFAQLGITVAFGVSMNKASVTALRLMFLAYSILTGITFSSLGIIYTGSTLFYAFAISAVYYFCLAFVGITTKKNLNNLGLLCLTGLVVMLLAEIVMLLLHVSVNIQLFSIIGLLLFTGITMWDVWRMKRIMENAPMDTMTRQKWTVYFALELYLDFINVFLYILRLFAAGSGSSSRR